MTQGSPAYNPTAPAYDAHDASRPIVAGPRPNLTDHIDDVQVLIWDLEDFEDEELPAHPNYPPMRPNEIRVAFEGMLRKVDHKLALPDQDEEDVLSTFYKPALHMIRIVALECTTVFERMHRSGHSVQDTHAYGRITYQLIHTLNTLVGDLYAWKEEFDTRAAARRGGPNS